MGASAAWYPSGRWALHGFRRACWQINVTPLGAPAEKAETQRIHNVKRVWPRGLDAFTTIFRGIASARTRAPRELVILKWRFIP